MPELAYHADFGFRWYALHIAGLQRRRYHMANDNRDRVGPLSDLNDFKVASDDPDVRGWDVISADGRRIGEVEDLIVDTSAMKVRYLDVELDDDFRAESRDSHRILIPIGQAQLHQDEDHVHVNAVSSTDVGTLPRYSGNWSRTEEDTVRRHFGTDTGRAPGSSDVDYYGHSHYDDSRFFGTRRGLGDAGSTRGGMSARGSTAGSSDSKLDTTDRTERSSQQRMTLSEEELDVRKSRQQSGELRVGKHVETEHVSRDVPVEREVASVERHKLTGDDARNASPTITDDEIRIPLMEEEVDVQKRAVAKEELVVKKDRVQETKHVEADLRKERADIRQDDDPSKRRNRG
jgi:uncharacterized protein (TIGR02271 family)